MKFIYIFILSIIAVSCSKSKTDVQIKLEREIENTFLEFEPTNNAFIFDIVQDETILFQGIHTSFLDTISREDESFGFAISLAFDVLDDEEFRKQQLFEKSLYHDEFIYYEYDGLMCYVLDIDGSPERGAKIYSNLLYTLENVKDSSEIEVLRNDQGKIEKRENSL